MHVSTVDDETILLAIFDERTTIGMVRLFAREASTSIGGILEETRKRPKLVGALAAPLTAEETRRASDHRSRLSRGRRPTRSASSGPPRAVFESVVEANEFDVPALESLREIYARLGDQAKLRLTLERLSSATGEPLPAAPAAPARATTATSASPGGGRAARESAPGASGRSAAAGGSRAPGGAPPQPARPPLRSVPPVQARSPTGAAARSGPSGGVRSRNDGRAGRSAGDGRRGRPRRARARRPAPTGPPAWTTGRRCWSPRDSSHGTSCTTPCASTGARRSGWGAC